MVPEFIIYSTWSQLPVVVYSAFVNILIIYKNSRKRYVQDILDILASPPIFLLVRPSHRAQKLVEWLMENNY